jgi:hypothetical protein
MKLLLIASSGVLLLAIQASTCEAIKPTEPKQATEPTVRTQKYGDTKVESLAAPDSGP